MTTGATIFSGGEGVGVGMRQAGIKHLWGVEWDDSIARVARDNGFHSITADVRDVNIGKLDRPDILHASPVCKNASVAKTGGHEAPEDVETAYATCRFIEKLRPGIFTLENVWGYRNFIAFRVILDCLRREGYAVDYRHLNAANYGVPQTRKRLILVAKLDGIPRRPEPTHARNPGGMFGLPKWIGWYEAIEDLIPTLPESRFAQWQLDRLPEFCDYTMTVDSAGYPDETGATVPVMRMYGEPVYCRREMRAFIVDDQNSGTPDDNGERGLTIRQFDAPMHTVSATQTKRSIRAWLSQGRVVTMTPRCLVRFQSFPDDYVLPAGKLWKALTDQNAVSFQDETARNVDSKLAFQVIGNSVPPLLYQRVIEANL